jgi:hypothetical protein
MHRSYITWQESNTFYPLIRAVFTVERCSQVTTLPCWIPVYTQPALQPLLSPVYLLNSWSQSPMSLSAMLILKCQKRGGRGVV